jgi:hypothetical protein
MGSPGPIIWPWVLDLGHRQGEGRRASAPPFCGRDRSSDGDGRGRHAGVRPPAPPRDPACVRHRRQQRVSLGSISPRGARTCSRVPSGPQFGPATECQTPCGGLLLGSGLETIPGGEPTAAVPQLPDFEAGGGGRTETRVRIPRGYNRCHYGCVVTVGAIGRSPGCSCRPNGKLYLDPKLRAERVRRPSKAPPATREKAPELKRFRGLRVSRLRASVREIVRELCGRRPAPWARVGRSFFAATVLRRRVETRPGSDHRSSADWSN